MHKFFLLVILYGCVGRFFFSIAMGEVGHVFDENAFKKDTKQDWKSKWSVSALRRDITYIKDTALPAYDKLVFTKDGGEALVAHTDGHLKLWQTVPTQCKTISGAPLIKEVQHLVLSPDDQRAFVFTYDSVGKGLIAFVLAMPSLELLYQFSFSTFLDITFSKDGKEFFILQEDNLITRRRIVDGSIQATYRIPNYDEKNTYYTRIKRIALSKMAPTQLLLFDIGYAEDLSTIKKGMHVNMYVFDFEQQKIAEPLSLYYSANVTDVLPKRFTALAISPDGTYVFLGLRRKILSFHFPTHNKEELPVGDIIEELRFDPAGKFLLSTGGGTSSLWSIIENEQGVVRMLRRMVSHAIMLSFTPDYKYFVGAAKAASRLVYFQASLATHILDTPVNFVLYCAQKHTKLDVMKWLTNVQKKSKKNIKIHIDTTHNDQQTDLIFKKNLQYYARSIFNTASDYLYTTEELKKGASAMYLYTNGFEPIEIKVSEYDFEKKKEAFLKGWYKWNEIEFGFTQWRIFIKKANLFINGHPYSYNVAENERQPQNVLMPHFQDFNLDEPVE